MTENYKVADYTEETYCDICGRLLTVGDEVIPHDDGQHVFCSDYCKGQAPKTTPVEACELLQEPTVEASKKTCGFQAFGICPPCVLDPDHLGDHEDGFGGHYAPVPSDFKLVPVGRTKQLRYQRVNNRQNSLFRPVI